MNARDTLAVGIRARDALTVGMRAMTLLVAVASAQVALSAEAPAATNSAGQNVGQLTYEKWCAPCHAPGPQHPGTQALDALYKGSKPAALIQRTDLTPPIVKQFVRTGVSVMPFFRKTEISDAELDALATFLSRPK
jgi:mono/diheme cytochrome c family protein